MTKNELLKKRVSTAHGLFRPIYTFVEETPVYDEEENIIDWELIGYVEIITAEEHYQKWLIDKDNLPATEVNKMEVRLNQQEAAIGLLATQIAKNTLLQNGGMK